AGDTGRLTKVPGVGKRTAERIVLELKDKMILTTPVAATSPAGGRVVPTAKSEVLHATLTNLGFKGGEAERAIVALGTRVEAEPRGDLVRAALAILAR